LLPARLTSHAEYRAAAKRIISILHHLLIHSSAASRLPATFSIFPLPPHFITYASNDVRAIIAGPLRFISAEASFIEYTTSTLI
jgi:hypothetical protein